MRCGTSSPTHTPGVSRGHHSHRAPVGLHKSSGDSARAPRGSPQQGTAVAPCIQQPDPTECHASSDRGISPPAWPVHSQKLRARGKGNRAEVSQCPRLWHAVTPRADEGQQRQQPAGPRRGAHCMPPVTGMRHPCSWSLPLPQNFSREH